MEVKENDIVKRVSPTGVNLVARVRWVNEKEEAGLTYLSPDSWKGSAQVVDLDELEVVKEGIGDLKNTSTKDLIAAINRLRGARLPKKLAARKSYKRKKKTTKDKLEALFAKGGDELDALIAKAAKEIRDEKGGK